MTGHGRGRITGTRFGSRVATRGPLRKAIAADLPWMGRQTGRPVPTPGGEAPVGTTEHTEGPSRSHSRNNGDRF